MRRKCDEFAPHFLTSVKLWYIILSMQKNNILPLILQEGESYKVEFKEKMANLDREIVAFSNASGGSIFLGVADDGKPIGIDITNRLKSQVLDIAQNCDPSIRTTFSVHPESNILEIQVAEGSDKPYRCKDGFFLRIGPSSQKLKRDEIITLINNSGKIHFDEAFCCSFQYPKDFSKSLLDDFLKQCDVKTKLSNEDILLSLNVIEEKNKKLRFTNAGVLFFAKSPQKFYPESYVTAVKYKTQDRFSIIDKKDFTGSLIQQIEDSITFIMRHMSVEIGLSSSLQTFSPAHNKIYEYPLLALREALINAIAHRDYYYDASHIYIHMYPNRIEIENPGGLYHGLSLENLGKRSVRRNRLIADLLHRAGFIERVGSGFDRMKQSLTENNNPPLEVTATNFFNIRFYKRAKTSLEKSLTPRQICIYNLLQEHHTISSRDAEIALGVSNDSILRDLKVMLDLNLIVKTGSGKSTIYLLKE